MMTLFKYVSYPMTNEVFHNGNNIAILLEHHVMINSMKDDRYHIVPKENIKAIYHAIIEQEAKE